MKLLGALLISIIFQSSFQKECVVEIYSPPFSACDDPHWGSVIISLEPGNQNGTFQMSDVCQKGAKKSVKVNVADTRWAKNGYLHVFQADKGPRMSGTMTSEWFIETISVNCGNDAQAMFGIGRSLITSRWYDFSNYDTGFVQTSFCTNDQNTAEISENNVKYQRTEAFENGPLMVRSLTLEDAFEFKALITSPSKAGAAAKAKQIAINLTPGILLKPRFSSLEDLNNFTLQSGFPKPEVMDFWDKDSWFAAQRIQGVNPSVISSITSIPAKFKLDLTRASKIIKDEELISILYSGRMFIADLEILNSVDGQNAPMALFYVSKNNELKPLAIQLTQDAPAEQVFYPDDPSNAWLLAKMYYNAGEAIHHQMFVHLGNVHILMDGVGALMYQHLPPSHPIFKLLKSFLYQMFGNNLFGTEKLLGEGGVMDKFTKIKSKGSMQLLREVIKRYDYNVINPVINEDKRKTKTIKVYPHRDRVLPLYKVIHAFVRNIMKNYYRRKRRNPSNDGNLRQWRKALSRSQTCQGAGIKNLPGNDKTGVMNFHELVDLMSTFVYHCSVGHGTIHNPQYHEFAYHLNYPLILNQPPPTTKDISDAHIVECLGTKIEVLGVMSLGFNFIHDGEGVYFGDFDRQFLYSPRDMAAIKRYKARLEQVSKMKYKQTAYPYTFADIGTIRNSPRV